MRRKKKKLDELLEQRKRLEHAFYRAQSAACMSEAKLNAFDEKHFGMKKGDTIDTKGMIKFVTRINKYSNE